MNIEKNKRIDEIIGSLDNVQKATVPDFFYTRLKARMSKELVIEPQKSGILRPAYIISALLLILIVNAAVILKGNFTGNTVAADTELMQSIASEYRINTNLTYEINQ